METPKDKTAPCLWFATQAEEAARFYVGLIPNSRIVETSYYIQDQPIQDQPLPAGTVLTVEFELDGRRYTALNGGPEFTFNEAVSIQLYCEDQAEIDRYWDALTADGGQESQCGWLKDKYGLSWQVVPRKINSFFISEDSAAVKRAWDALMPMRKLDLAALEAAFDGK
ncbi:VOC family protein [Arthrobacter ginkgonis]|uniref:VOC family protein n=1 Tax=Arthrobacter ginkgonis TaxID=1630594 RepID=A0ABP7C136_9MICC